MKRILIACLVTTLAPAVAYAQDKTGKPAEKAPAKPADKPAVKAPEPPAAPAPAPEIAATVKAFEGNWSFDAQLTMPGATEPTKFKMKMPCKKIAEGNGVSCAGSAKVPKLGVWSAGVLVGFDPAGKRTHFMAITNMGEVHDHVCTWKDTTLACDPLKYGTETETLSFSWTDPKSMTFTSETKGKNGTISFAGTGKRPKAPK